MLLLDRIDEDEEDGTCSACGGEGRDDGALCRLCGGVGSLAGETCRQRRKRAQLAAERESEVTP